jgi:hypothetical protein
MIHGRGRKQEMEVKDVKKQKSRELMPNMRSTVNKSH